MSETSIRMSLPTRVGSVCWYSIGVDLDRAGVQACLVGEGARPDIGLARVRGHVRHLADRVGDPGRLGQSARWQHLPAELELEVGHHRQQVGVAGPLAVAVEGALHLHHPGRRPRRASWPPRSRCRCGSGCPAAPRARRHRAARRRRSRSAACRRWCRTAPPPRRRPRPPPAPPRARRPGRTGSRRRSARRPGTPAGPRRRRKATVSGTMARFSAAVVRSARSTWRRSLLATRVTTGARESSSARTCGSSAATTPARRVAPNAVRAAPA